MTCKYGCINGKIYMPVTNRLEPCPDCTTAGSLFEREEEEVEVILKDLNIPEDYDITSLIDEELINKDVRNLFTGESIQSVINAMIDINKGVENKTVYKNSIYLYTPAVDIKVFAFNCMLRAVEAGLTVAPLISVNTLYDIQKSREFDFELFEKVYYSQYSYEQLGAREKQFYGGFKELKRLNCTYADFLTSEILFLEATSNTTNVTWVALADILAERANRGLPTYVLGYWSSKQLHNSSARFILRPEEWKSKLNKLAVAELVSKGNVQYSQQGKSFPNTRQGNNANNKGGQKPYGNAGIYGGQNKPNIGSYIQEQMKAQGKKEDELL